MEAEQINHEAAVIARMEIQRSLGRVEGKLDQIIAGMTLHEVHDKDRFDVVHEELNSLGKRTSSTERKVWYASGVVVAITMFLSQFPISSLWK